MSDHRYRPGPSLEKHRYLRTSVLFPAELVSEFGRSDCHVLNISVGGAKVRLTTPWAGELQVALRIAGFALPAEIAWQSDTDLGLCFIGDPLEIESLVRDTLKIEKTAVDRRQFSRISVLMKATIFSGGMAVESVVLNLSSGGAKVRLLQPMTLTKSVLLRIDRFGDFPGMVTWRDGHYFGVRFQMDPEDVIERAGDILAPPPEGSERFGQS